MEYEIKRLQPGDELLAAETINNVWTPYGELTASGEYLTEFLANDNHYLYVALEDGKPVGIVLAYRLARPTREQAMMYLFGIDVLPSHQNRGIGTALIEALTRICVEEGMSDMWLGTSQSNLPAMACYQKAGGVRMGNDEAAFEWRF